MRNSFAVLLSDRATITSHFRVGHVPQPLSLPCRHSCRHAAARAPRVAMSNQRSAAGTSLAPETSARLFLWNEGLEQRFPESRAAALRSACATARCCALIL